MTRDDDKDRDVEQLFQRQRALDERRAPSFAQVVAPFRAVPYRRSWWPALVTAGVLAVAAVGVWRDRMRQDASAFRITAGDLHGPTDFLLDMASGQGPRAGAIPQIGDVNWYPLPPRSEHDEAVETRREIR